MPLKKAVIIFIILLICASALWAGDNAVFVDLGFSPDGRMYMFGQHGVVFPSLRPWAEIYVVDVARNSFVQNGRAAFTQNAPIRAGQDGSGVLHQLVSSNTALTSRHNINFQNQGLPLYISREESPPARGETIEFRDFINGMSYRAELIPVVAGSGQNVSSRFQINLSAAPISGGQAKTYTVGSPNFVRQGVAQYNFKRVLIDSTGSSIIFVIEMKRAVADGFDIRYMVETVRLFSNS